MSSLAHELAEQELASAAFAAVFLDKEAADAYEAHCRILAKIRQCAKWMASL